MVSPCWRLFKSPSPQEELEPGRIQRSPAQRTRAQLPAAEVHYQARPQAPRPVSRANGRSGNAYWDGSFN